MDLILWRHAEAEDGSPDAARKLTAKGRKQAEEMAQWLKPRLHKETRILVSPAVRAQQTARALTDEFKTIQEIEPGAPYQAILAAAGWPGHKGTVLVVGHQPTLGQTAAWLIAGDATEWNIKKAAIWWLTYRDRENQGQVVLRAVMSPELA
jgi:phosphohistidine phosphatase